MGKDILALVGTALMVFNFCALGEARPTGPEKECFSVTTYAPARHAEQDVQAAGAEAKRSAKRILLEVGGNWCVWCRILDKFFEQNPKLLELRARNFVLVKVNFSKASRNEMLLSRYPCIPGYPHLFVLDSDGKLLHSQDTGQLERGNSYNLEKFSVFLMHWARRS